MDRRTKIILAILCLIIAFMDISGLPAVVLFQIQFADLESYTIPLILNFCIIGLMALAVLSITHISYPFGFTCRGLSNGLKNSALPAIIAGALSFVAFFVGLYPFDYSPTISKILIEGILYYISVAIVEEFYVRGLFLNLVESMAGKQKNKTIIAIVVSSVVFGLGHIPDALGMGLGVAAFKFVSSTGLGLFLGTIYKQSGTIWVPIIWHILVNVCALPYCFTQEMRFESSTLAILIVTYSVLGIYSCHLMCRMNKNI